MSDPAQNALGPAPVTITQRTASLRLHSSAAATIASDISAVAAFSFSGRLSVIVATWPSIENRMCSVMRDSALVGRDRDGCWRTFSADLPGPRDDRVCFRAPHG